MRKKTIKKIILAFSLSYILILGHSYTTQAASLQPGSGFTGPTSEPETIGTEGEEGYDAKAIARWDVVPYQDFNSTFEIGVVAFHMVGINRVEFSVEGGPWQSVSQMTLNPRTGIIEYWTELEAADFPDGTVEVRAIAYPTVGQPRLIDSLYLYANSGGTLPRNTVYVSTSGNDSNNGSQTAPMATITNAIDVAGDGGKIIILDEGIYSLDASARRLSSFLNNDNYITVEPTPGLNRDNVIIGWPTRQQTRPYIAKVHFKGISFDFSTISQYYGGSAIWFDNCRWFQSEGWTAVYQNQMKPVRATFYVTDSLAEDMLYGFASAELVRNSTVRKISGDAYQLSKMVLNCKAINVDGTVMGHHTDLYQVWGHNENFIVYGLDTENIIAQCIFLDHYQSSHTNFAFVDVYFSTSDPQGGPPFTQFNAPHNHVILRNVRWPGQRMLFRTDFPCDEYPTDCRRFVANNVIFENCQLYPSDYDSYVVGTEAPEGVIFRNCYSAGTARRIGSIGNILTSEGNVVAFTVTSSFGEGSNVTYSAENLPTGAIFANRAFTWSPGYDQAGTYQVTFTATDGQTQESETVTITVNNRNQAPVLDAIGSKSTYEIDLLSFTINATDADGDSLTYSTQNLPTGATFTNQTFNWTPSYNQSGNYQVTFIVSDGYANDSETITITVNNVNRLPILDSIGNKTVNVGDRLSFSISATDPDGDSLVYSASGLPSGATFTNQTFSWSPLHSQLDNYQITFTVSDGQLQDLETVTIAVRSGNAAQDNTSPNITNCAPASGAIQVPLNNLLTLQISDDNSGVDPDSISIKVNSNTVYSGNTASYSSPYGTCRRTGTMARYSFTYQPDDAFDFDQVVSVNVSATDIAGNNMPEYSYSFQTMMRSFGKNLKATSSQGNLNEGHPTTVIDNNGNIWVIWHAGPPGERDIYLGKLAADTGAFEDSIRLTHSIYDECNPALAVGSDNTLYAIWQDNRRGNWDIYAATSSQWSNKKLITDSNDNQINPAIAVDSQSPNRAYVVWQDDQAGNQDIYIASSTNKFTTETTSRITSNAADQTEPAIAISSGNIVYVVWTDKRNSSADIFGASSNNGPWTNVPIVLDAKDQISPKIVLEPDGSLLHLLWVDNTPDNQDIYYAISNGLPDSPVTGRSIIDDTSGADQLQPVITASKDIQGSPKIFACWQDKRYASGSSGDTDLFFAELSAGYAGTNVLVNDDRSNADQTEPAIGADTHGHPYLVWTDYRNETAEIYYAGSTYVNPIPLVSRDVVASSGATVGTEPDAIADIDDVSVVIPSLACPSDATITIAEIQNTPALTVQCLGAYDFGPSGIEFSQPVTVIIPYEVSDSGGSASAYWYNSLTAALSQQGITNVQDIVISSTIHALRFDTIHFTPLYIVVGDDGGGSGSGGGGGCSISPVSDITFSEFILPFVGLSAVILLLKLRDRRNRTISSAQER